MVCWNAMKMISDISEKSPLNNDGQSSFPAHHCAVFFHFQIWGLRRTFGGAWWFWKENWRVLFHETLIVKPIQFNLLLFQWFPVVLNVWFVFFSLFHLFFISNIRRLLGPVLNYICIHRYRSARPQSKENPMFLWIIPAFLGVLAVNRRYFLPSLKLTARPWKSPSFLFFYHQNGGFSMAICSFTGV